jgi:hypothetical protein
MKLQFIKEVDGNGVQKLVFILEGADQAATKHYESALMNAIAPAEEAVAEEKPSALGFHAAGSEDE